jgi:hypothetical protein
VFALAFMVIVMGFGFFVPIIYIPAVQPSCNGLCSLSGHTQYYVSISYRLIRHGALYWPANQHGTYEVTTLFGSYHVAV